MDYVLAEGLYYKLILNKEFLFSYYRLRLFWDKFNNSIPNSTYRGTKQGTVIYLFSFICRKISCLTKKRM